MSASIDAILAHPGFQRAQGLLRDGHDRLVDEIIALTEIPSPPFKEERRAEAFRAMLAEAGLDAALDGIGNVLALRKGRGNGNVIVAAAHLDTVFPEGTDVTVRREGTKLFAPGVGDDTRGLAVLLAIARALDAAGIETEHDILFVGDVGEEGKGDLRGIRHLFAEGAWRERIKAFFTLDSPNMEELVTRAVGSRRYRVAFKGPGGHSLMAFGIVNPAYALGEMVAGMSRLEVPKEPQTTFCASVFGGGTSINAIPEEVWVEVDLRSTDAGELACLDAALHRLIEQAVANENARASTASGEITAEAKLLGDRPAGQTAPDSAIVTASTAALGAFGFEVSHAASSTDANIPMSLGIPAVKIGTGGTGGRAHSVEEWIDVEPEASLRGLSATLAAILAVAGLAD
ncbi:M20/M25/M40 family metallo-hydrolase [Mangrovibrevibacter kandeliae]|uniref:M20/M25/M40 family metallo-hydrolase n=1 Tax=Mangrovibrevibacter kandeliae TaxID=2968473 RepID=UPI002118E45B|nr:M20/M25/M40 family metallo-hydrolase [Aurantimonas sp. CSK15Z-1]MCQ8782067.1 M20/M25/M40 family metallo-hydrolase [Aurantimonas sp. CSK15Z-1]